MNCRIEKKKRNQNIRLLMTNTDFGQFHRIEQMIGQEALKRLQNSFIVIAGLGAVGSFAAETLARAGIGRFLLIDCDIIKPSNINRQLFATWDTVGQTKTDAAEKRLLSINPNCCIEKRNLLLNSVSMPHLFQTFQTQNNSPDFLIDAIDSLGPKVELIVAALASQIPLISSMGAALKMNPSLIQTGRLTDVSYCPLAAILRKHLRRRGVCTDDVYAVFSTEAVREKHQDKIISKEFSEDEKPSQGRRRNTLGSLPTITGMFGLHIAHYAMSYLMDEKFQTNPNR